MIFETAFQKFMLAYWNQMAPDRYPGFRDALNDFRRTEGEPGFKALAADLRRLAREGRFPPLSRISAAYADPFWSDFDMIATWEDILSCGDLIDLDA